MKVRPFPLNQITSSLLLLMPRLRIRALKIVEADRVANDFWKVAANCLRAILSSRTYGGNSLILLALGFGIRRNRKA